MDDFKIWKYAISKLKLIILKNHHEQKVNVNICVNQVDQKCQKSVNQMVNVNESWTFLSITKNNQVIILYYFQ